ncbi:MAG: response regulator [Gammaproteobacteria bacterium]|nr:response regulator [Gammaproteobacteria bacterium]
MYSIFSATLTEAVIVEDQPVIHSILEQLLIRDQRINRITVENENNLMLAQVINNKNQFGRDHITFKYPIAVEGEIFGSLHLIWNFSSELLLIEKVAERKRNISLTAFILLLTLLLFWQYVIVIRPLSKISNALMAIATDSNDDASQVISQIPHSSKELSQIKVIVKQLVDLLYQKEKHQQEVELEKEKTETIVHSLGDGLAVINVDGTIESINPKLEEMVGVKALSLIGTPFERWVFKEGNSYLLKSERDGGGPVPINLTRSPWSNNDQKLYGEVLILHDLREVLDAEKTKLSAQAKDEFLASMSHELRTPLTSIIGNSEYLQEQKFDSTISEIIHDIEIAGRAQLALVNDILDMSKIESGKFTIEESPYNLSVLLDDIEKMLSIRAQDAGLELVIKQRNHEPMLLQGDGQRIGQILINLLGNAIKFTEKGRVSLETDVTDDKLVFAVTDSGIGISTKVIENLFNRFKQADGSISRRFGGSGLGLYISMNLAEMMGGTIEVSSSEGVGSTFQLILPYRRSAQKERSSERGGDKSGSVLDEKLDGHVLVAEDTPELQLLERRILEKIGLEVTVANNGLEAVKLAASESFDLILMDMQMPVMDGVEATNRIREAGYQTPIIALTANVMQKHRDQFDEAGGDGFIGKPIDKQELIRVLKKYLH